MAAHNKSKNTFDFLQRNTHRVNEAYAYQLPLTPNPHPYKNDSQYWLFSDLYNLFGGQYVGRHKDIDNTMQTAITFSDFEKFYCDVEKIFKHSSTPISSMGGNFNSCTNKSIASSSNLLDSSLRA